MSNFLTLTRQTLDDGRWLPREGLQGLLSFSVWGRFDIQTPAWITHVGMQYRRTTGPKKGGVNVDFVCQPSFDKHTGCCIFNAPNLTRDELPPRRVMEYEVFCEACGFSAQVCFIDDHKDQVRDPDYQPKFCSACGSKTLDVGKTYWGG